MLSRCLWPHSRRVFHRQGPCLDLTRPQRLLGAKGPTDPGMGSHGERGQPHMRVPWAARCYFSIGCWSGVGSYQAGYRLGAGGHHAHPPPASSAVRQWIMIAAAPGKDREVPGASSQPGDRS